MFFNAVTLGIFAIGNPAVWFSLSSALGWAIFGMVVGKLIAHSGNAEQTMVLI
jgi:hypothetical protein